jgi:hypothetical protein
MAQRAGSSAAIAAIRGSRPDEGGRHARPRTEVTDGHPFSLESRHVKLDCALHLALDRVARGSELRRVGVEDGAHRVDLRGPGKRPPRRQHLVQNRAEAEDVGPERMLGWLSAAVARAS